MDRILRRPEVEEITGFSRSSLYAAIADGHFPKPVKLTARAVGWKQSDIEAWFASRKQAA